MATLEFENREENLGGSHKVMFCGIFGAIDGTTVRHFEEELNKHFDSGLRQLVLEFGGLKYINSTGMGLLVKITDKYSDGGGSVRLANVSPKISDLFDMLGLLSIFQIFSDAEQAKDALAKELGVGAESPAAAEPEEAVVAEAVLVEEPESELIDFDEIALAEEAGSDPVMEAIEVDTPMMAEDPPHQSIDVTAETADESAQAELPTEEIDVTADTVDESFDLGRQEILDDTGVPVEIEERSVVTETFPMDYECAGCGTIEFPCDGKFRCPRCSNYFVVLANGSVEDFNQNRGRLIELKIPCESSFLPHLRSIISQLATEASLGENNRNELDEGLAEICAIMEEEGTPQDFIQASIVADPGKLALGIVASSSIFAGENGAGHPRLRTAAGKFDRVELQPLTNQGELLKLVKNS